MVFELTETALLRSEQTAQEFIDGIGALGCGLALDDFGTGYGGFTYLKRFPVDYLKIDIEFVRDLPRDQASQHVVHAVVALAKGFGQKTVAEGVEDAETLALLRDYGVDYAQGYFLGRPAPLTETLERPAR
jgi:EAL domain-containing protein (putative c-di-GMP-specific phosphodiesterase class I)